MCSLLYDATYVLRIGVVDASMTMGMGGGLAGRRHARAAHWRCGHLNDHGGVMLHDDTYEPRIGHRR